MVIFIIEERTVLAIMGNVEEDFRQILVREIVLVHSEKLKYYSEVGV